MRPRKSRLVRNAPITRFYKPRGIPMSELKTVFLKDEEWEAILLADHKGHTQEEAAELMGISRPTFSRVLAGARQAVAKALVEGAALEIGGGDFRMVTDAAPLNLEKDMTIAFAISGEDLDSPIDDRFGRAPNFLVYDTGSGTFEISPNEALGSGQGAGLKAAEFVIRSKVKAVVAGEFGPKANDMLSRADIRIYSVKSTTVRQALAQFFDLHP